MIGFIQNKKGKLIAVGCLGVVLACFLIFAFLSTVHTSRKPTNKTSENYQQWSIGIYTGKGPFDLIPSRKVTNPVLKGSDVTDKPALFVADPFMIKNSNIWYMFFEVFDQSTNQGDIGIAESIDGFIWTYKEIIIDEPFHLSFPYVFKYNEEFYLVPESQAVNAIRLYKAVKFPTQWEYVKSLISGLPFRDTCVIRFNNVWWLFTASTPKDTLRLYYSDLLLGPWVEHPLSPIINGDPNIARPGGRIISIDKKLIRFAQDCDPTYGNSIHAFEITEISKTTYSEKRIDRDPILGPTGVGWNKDGMHQIDAHQYNEDEWIACVDGWISSIKN